MAVDTRDKRASVLGWGLASLLVLPAPGALDQGDRQQTAYSYRGISVASPVEAEPVVTVVVSATDRTIEVGATERLIVVRATTRDVTVEDT
jgi:hypothetical protein